MDFVSVYNLGFAFPNGPEGDELRRIWDEIEIESIIKTAAMETSDEIMEELEK